jgi:uncharacterized membrane protein YgcG
MQCPDCKAPLEETSKECPSCGLSLQSANALLGPMPRLGKGLVDTLGVVEKKTGNKITRALGRLNQRFPQVEMHVLVAKFNPQHPLATHLFWIFNQGDFCASNRKGGKNHSILLGLDPRHGRIGLIVGYGLEPYLPQKALDDTLEKAHPLLGKDELAKAILTVIQCLEQLMESVCDELPEIADEDPVQTSGSIEY